MKKTLAKKVKVSPYPSILYVGNSLDSVKALLEEDGITIDNWDRVEEAETSSCTDAYVLPLEMDGESCGLIISVFKIKPNACLIAHECTHIKNNVLEFSGVNQVSFTICDETEAYLMEFLVREIWDLFYRS